MQWFAKKLYLVRNSCTRILCILVLSKAFSIEVEISSGFRPIPDNKERIESFFLFAIKLTLFGNKVAFDVEWLGETDNFIGKLIDKYTFLRLIATKFK